MELNHCNHGGGGNKQKKNSEEQVYHIVFTVASLM